MPLGIFWDIATGEKGIEALIINGEPSNEALISAWEAINIEYASIVDPGNNSKIKEIHRLESLRAKVTVVSFGCYILSQGFDQEVYDNLCAYVPTIKMDPANDPHYLMKIAPQFKRWQMEVERMELALAKEGNKAKRITRADFMDICVEIERELGISISESDTVLKYAVAYRKYQIIARNREANKNKPRK